MKGFKVYKFDPPLKRGRLKYFVERREAPPKKANLIFPDDGYEIWNREAKRDGYGDNCVVHRAAVKDKFVFCVVDGDSGRRKMLVTPYGPYRQRDLERFVRKAEKLLL